MIGIVNDCINKLPKKFKQGFILSKKRGFTNIEISKCSDIYIKTVEVHINFAFKNIRSNIPKNI